MKLTPHFSEEEFTCPCGCNQLIINTKLVTQLEKARVQANLPFKITSGYRCPDYNAKLSDSVDGSAHTQGKAADVSCRDSRSRFVMLTAFLDAGFDRIGVAKTFIHCDVDETKDPAVVWLY